MLYWRENGTFSSAFSRYRVPPRGWVGGGEVGKGAPTPRSTAPLKPRTSYPRTHRSYPEPISVGTCGRGGRGVDARGCTGREVALEVRQAVRAAAGAANRLHRLCGPGGIGSHVDGSSFRSALWEEGGLARRPGLRETSGAETASNRWFGPLGLTGSGHIDSNRYIDNARYDFKKLLDQEWEET
jgi:hypothetical protein